MRDFKNLKSEGNAVLNTCNNNDNSSDDDYSESVVRESSAKPNLDCQPIITISCHHYCCMYFVPHCSLT